MEKPMPAVRPSAVEETLDPESWDSLRSLAHRVMDDALDYLQTVRDRPVWQPVPGQVKQSLRQPLPVQPQDLEAVYRDFTEQVMPYAMGNIHPRFWGWVIGTGDPVGVLAELLAATMNPNLGGGDHAANYVEQQVIDWCKEIMGFPEGSSGILVSGGSMANLVGLTVARNAMAAQTGVDLRKAGLRKMRQQMVVYASEQAHSSIQKGLEMLGLGSDNLHSIPVDENFQMRVDALKDQLQRDRQQGLLPFCVVGAAGTVNTGAFDDLNALADLCEAEGLWFHVDGAFGALSVLAPELRHLTLGMERADSLAFDLHKWMSMPIEIGCTLVRKEEDHRSAFALTPDYLTHAERGLAGGSLWFSDYGIQLSRSFRALKAWMMLKTHGSEKFGRIIQQNVDQACYLSDKVDAESDLERVAPTPLNIVCFRYTGSLPENARNDFNHELIIRLQEQGIAVASYTMLNGKYALRVANVNHRSQRSDFDLLVQEVLRIGRAMERE